MNQLDLFTPAKATEDSVEKTLAVQKRQAKKIDNSAAGYEIKKIEEVKHENFGKGEAYPLVFKNKETEVKTVEEGKNNIVFEDGNITVKIKAGQDVNMNEKGGRVTRPDAKVKPRKTIVNSQPTSAYSIELNDTISQLKNNIKANLLKDNSVEKKKKASESRIPQKRGRKSLKDHNAEVDLIEIPDDDVLFQKQYYSISEVAGWFRVNTSLLRFWENEFDILKPRKNRKGDRLFRPEDVKNLQIIYQLLRQKKYSIEGAKEYLKTDLDKATSQLQLINTLQSVRNFLLELRANF